MENGVTVTSTQTASEYCEKNILVIPQSLYAMEDVTALLQSGDTAVFYKQLQYDLCDVEFYTNTPCIVYIENGQETITSADNKSYIVEEGTAILLHQGLNLHSDYVKTEANLKAYLIFLGQDVIDTFLATAKIPKQSSLPVSSDLLKIDCLINNEQSLRHSLSLYFQSLITMQQQGIQSPELIKTKLLECLHLFFMSNSQLYHALSLSKKTTETPKRNLSRLMSNNRVYDLSISDLAHLSGRSVASFSRDFKALYQVSPKQWMQDKRMVHARTLLAEKEQSVTHVAFDLGYENVSHFIKSFKDKYGVTPKQFQQDIS